MRRLPSLLRLLPWLCLSALPLGCAGPDSSANVESDAFQENVASWDEFLKGVYREPESGLFVVDGDTPVSDVKQLQEFFERHVQHGQLIVHRSGGVDARWSDAQKRNLTYCVSTGFGGQYDAVVAAMAQASAAWEAAADVDFKHLAGEDANCTATNANVLFDVRPVNSGGNYLARAFFPGEARRARNVLVDGDSFTVRAPLSVTGILRHELGHTLGFRHEHTRPEAGTCFEDSSWRALTPYDSASVMHYPQCNGTGDRSLSLSDKDKAGVQALYGAPSGSGTPPPPPPPTGTVTTERFMGVLLRDGVSALGPFAVTPGTSFDAVMSGTGDADLYVRFGAQPTLRAYDCRPYLSSSSESCQLTVPAGQTTAYIMVRGYTAASYSLSVTYTKPSGGGSGGDALAPSFGGLGSASAVSASEVSLSWSAASDNLSAPEAIVYDVYRSTSAAVSYATPLLTTGAGATSVRITGLAAGTTYYFAVRARDAAGNRDANTEVRSVATPGSGGGGGTGASFEDEVLALVNQRRAEGANCGGQQMPPVAALTMNASLRNAARLHSEDMGRNNYFSHTSLDGRTPVDRVRAAGYTGASIGENIAAGYTSPAEVMAGWMSSAGHCRNIMNGSYRSIGIGYALNTGSTYRHYWTQDFGGQ